MSGHRIGGGSRLAWQQLPAGLRSRIEEILGDPVVGAASQPGGFSPGSADRVVTATGRRAFVKTADARANAQSADIHRSEATVLGLLPDGLPVARLLGTVDDDGWVALVLTDVDGRHPHLPWLPEERDHVLDALAGLTRVPLPGPVAAAFTPLPDAMAEMFTSWPGVRPDVPLPLPADLAGWVRAQLGRLHEAATSTLPALAGDRLVHVDVRADNLLLRPDGSVVVVDWPWAAVGAGWFDAVSLLVNLRLYDPGRPVELSHPAYAGATPADVDGVLAGLAGFFTTAALLPPPPGLPTLRAFQAEQAVVTLALLRERWTGQGDG